MRYNDKLIRVPVPYSILKAADDKPIRSSRRSHVDAAPEADLNGNGDMEPGDLAFLLGQYGEDCN
jgi:hypothetical protein